MKITTILLLALGLLLATPLAQAQDLALPALSPEQTVTQNLGTGKLTLKYARPSARGRKVFGKVVPYGEVWRTGANAASTLTFDDTLLVQGKPLAPGTYAIFTIPQPGMWTIIFSKNTEQWGSGKYDPKDDALRIQVPAQELGDRRETFTMSFEDLTYFTANLCLTWERICINIPLKLNQQAKIEAAIQKALTAEKKPYFRVAMYYYNSGTNLKQALELITLADKDNTTQPWVKYNRAKMQMESGDKVGAKQTAEEGLKIAKEIKNAEYERNLTELLEQLN